MVPLIGEEFIDVALSPPEVVPRKTLYPTTPAVVLAVQDRITSCVPAPDRDTVCGLLLALSVMLSEAASAPATEGVKNTAIVQLAPAASELPHALL